MFRKGLCPPVSVSKPRLNNASMTLAVATSVDAPTDAAPDA